MPTVYDQIAGASVPDDEMTPEQQAALLRGRSLQAQVAAQTAASPVEGSDIFPPQTGPVAVPPGMHMSSMTTRQTQAGPGAPAYLLAPPSDSEVRSVMDQISQVRKQAATPADMSAIDSAEADAKQLYQDRANRADWLSVAEKIGNAAIKFGQADAAIHHNVDVSQMKDLAPTDWEKRVDRYAGDYKTDLDALERKRAGTREMVNEQNRRAQQDYENQLQPLQDKAKFLQYKYGQESADYRRSIQDAARDSHMMQMEQFRENQSGNRQELTEDRQLRALQAKDYQQQLKQIQEQKKNATAAAQFLSQQEDLDPKTVQKLEVQNPGLMGRAGITPEQLGNITKAAQVPGRFYGTNTDPEKRNALIQEQVLAPLEQKEMTLRQALDHVLGGGQQAPAAPAQTSVPVKTMTQAQLQDYARQHFSGNIEAARKFLGQNGYQVNP